MYKITGDTGYIGMTEAPTYITLADNGCFILCAEEEATGIVHGGTPYHLLGREVLEGAAGTVMLEAVDGGAALADMQSAVDNLTVAALMGGGDLV